MHRIPARLSALLVAGAWVGAACGGKVVVDGGEEGASTTSGGAGGSSTSSASAGSGGATGGGGCDAQSHTIDPAGFDVTCTAASDCVGVYLGNFCSKCRCPFSAINVADQMKYEAQRQLLEAGAPPGTCFCPVSHPICEQGQCATMVP